MILPSITAAMMILFVITFVAGLTYTLYKSSQDWIGVWRGKKIRVHKTFTKTQLFYNEEEIPLQDIDKTFQGSIPDPLHGEVPVYVSIQRDSNGYVGGCQLVVDGEIITTLAAPRDMWGASLPNALPQLKETIVVQGTTISDPRFAAAERLYESICAEAKEDVETIALLDDLHKNLIEHILLAERLTQSKSDYIALGNDGGELDILEKETQERIQLMLASLQDVHLAIIQRNFSAGNETFLHVRDVLLKIQADVEVEDSKLDSIRKKRMAQHNAQQKKQI